MSDEILPRHVLCLLGAPNSYAALMKICEERIAATGAGFEIDTEYSVDEHDERMPNAFNVCWDRVHPDGYADEDVEAVENHGCVIYLLSPPLVAGTHLEVSANALALIAPLFDAGLVALKGESAGVAHGVNRWKALAAEAAIAHKNSDKVALARACRLAWAKRPISNEGWLQSIGYHLIGMPEISIDDDLGSQLELSHAMDAIADHLYQHGIEATVPLVEGELEFVSDYDEDHFKHNPYGMIWCRALLR
jgi:hypothetical protein